MIVWFRRDLRVHDHQPLVTACREAERVVCAFCLDPAILDDPETGPTRVRYLVQSLHELAGALAERGGRLVVRHGDPVREIPGLAAEVDAQAVFVHGDVTEYAATRDDAVAERLAADGRRLVAFDGLTAVPPDALRTQTGTPYTVFTPFRRSWDETPKRDPLRAPRTIPSPTGVPSERLPGVPDGAALQQQGGEEGAIADLRRFGREGGPIERYHETRNHLATETSRLSAHLHFGTLSPSQVIARASGPGQGRAVYRSEICWRDFYFQINHRFRSFAHQEIREDTRDMRWSEREDYAAAWREGRTGFPVVDAAMRQLLATGWMHNRARMVVASLHSKELWLDWRLGAGHFLRHLTDGDESSNTGGWQWTAGTGTDPQQYRVFNPVLQARKFDPDGAYIRRWVPELARVPDAFLGRPWELGPLDLEAAGVVLGRDYPEPIVDRVPAAARARERYREGKERGRAAGGGAVRRAG